MRNGMSIWINSRMLLWWKRIQMRTLKRTSRVSKRFRRSWGLNRGLRRGSLPLGPWRARQTLAPPLSSHGIKTKVQEARENNLNTRMFGRSPALTLQRESKILTIDYNITKPKSNWTKKAEETSPALAPGPQETPSLKPHSCLQMNKSAGWS